MDQKKIDLLDLMIKSKLIELPESVSHRTLKMIDQHFSGNKNRLIDALVSHEFSKLPAAGCVARAEACYWAIYGQEKCPTCGK